MNKNYAPFFKRAEAYLLDVILIALATSILILGYKEIFHYETPITDKYLEESEAIVKKYEKGIVKENTETTEPTEEEKEEVTEEKIDINAYLEEYTGLAEKYYADMYLESMPENLTSFVLYVLYFVVLQFYLGGQTLGKKLSNIKVVDEKNKKPSFNKLLLRGIILYGLYATVIEMIMVFASKSSFYNLAQVLDNLTSCVVLVSIVLVAFNKNKRGLHDMIAKTDVVIDE